MPLERRLGVGILAALALVALVATAGVVRFQPQEPAPASTTVPPVMAAAPEVNVRSHGVPDGRCGRVTFTPRSASDRHRGDLCRPSEDVDPRGAVILIHGGGGYSGDRSTMREWAGWYRSEGFVTLSIDYTLMGDGSPDPVYPRPEQDVKAAIQWTRLQAERLGIDPQRILLHGSSAGARLAAQAFVTAEDRWFNGADLYPGVPQDAAGLIGFYGYYDGDTLEAERYYGGPPDTRNRRVRSRWEHANSVAQAAHATGPVLLFHGDIDGLITVAQTERFGAALIDAGIDV